MDVHDRITSSSAEVFRSERNVRSSNTPNGLEKSSSFGLEKNSAFGSCAVLPCDSYSGVLAKGAEAGFASASQGTKGKRLEKGNTLMTTSLAEQTETSFHRKERG